MPAVAPAPVSPAPHVLCAAHAPLPLAALKVPLTHAAQTESVVLSPMGDGSVPAAHSSQPRFPAAPWYFPGVEDYRALLRGAGFSVAHMELFQRPTQIPGGFEDWLWTFCEGFLNAVPDDGRRAFIEELEDALAPELADSRGRWSVDYVRLRFQAVRD